MKAFYFKRVPVWIDKFFKEITWRKKEGFQELYLTFDDGPNPDSSYKIAALLKSLGIKATFFCLGQQVNSHVEICHHLIEEGHVVANHNLVHHDGWRVNLTDYIDGVVQCQKILEEQKLTAKKLYRPPYGRVSKGQLKELRQMNFDIVNWSLMSGDFDPSLSNDSLLKRLLTFQDGDIIVLHDHKAALGKLYEVLPVLVEIAVQRGFNFKTL